MRFDPGAEPRFHTEGRTAARAREVSIEFSDFLLERHTRELFTTHRSLAADYCMKQSKISDRIRGARRRRARAERGAS